MLFNSYVFIFIFLPVVLLGYLMTGHGSARLKFAWLVVASLFFYGWWNPSFVILLVCSILFNFSLGNILIKAAAEHGSNRGRTALAAGIALNLCLLGYYKYADFFLSSANSLLGMQWSAGRIVLPLGISFFTFTQIAFLIDAKRGEVKENNFLNYSLFVTYFPHLIAGPILHHREMMSQFAGRDAASVRHEHLSMGLTIFSIGLFKKAALADSVAPCARTVFEAASNGHPLTFIEAWTGALGYSMQLYFDFSGYSDMAVGLSLLFGIRIPINFYSPYKAVNIIEFWRRWHISLSRFLKEYLYVPLGGNRQGSFRRLLNITATMMIGGFWHGAGWTYIFWGGLHGIYLVINHLWRDFRRFMGQDIKQSTRRGRALSRIFTFLAVVIAWVIFRADTPDSALAVFRGMSGMNGLVLPEVWRSYTGTFGEWMSVQGIEFGALPGLKRALHGPVVVAGLLLIAMSFPNTEQLMQRFGPTIDIFRGERSDQYSYFRWNSGWRWAATSAILFVTGIVMSDRVSEFLYFQF